jgi:hypothetical protein
MRVINSNIEQPEIIKADKRCFWLRIFSICNHNQVSQEDPAGDCVRRLAVQHYTPDNTLWSF